MPTRIAGGCLIVVSAIAPCACSQAHEEPDVSARKTKAGAPGAQQQWSASIRKCNISDDPCALSILKLFKERCIKTKTPLDPQCKQYPMSAMDARCIANYNAADPECTEILPYLEIAAGRNLRAAMAVFADKDLATFTLPVSLDSTPGSKIERPFHTLAHVAVLGSEEAGLAALKKPPLYKINMDRAYGKDGYTVAHAAVDGTGRRGSREAASLYALQHPEIYTLAQNPIGQGDPGLTVAHLAVRWNPGAARYALLHPEIYTLKRTGRDGVKMGETVAHTAASEDTAIEILKRPEVYLLRESDTVGIQSGKTVAHQAVLFTDAMMFALERPEIYTLAYDDSAGIDAGLTVAHVAVQRRKEAAWYAIKRREIYQLAQSASAGKNAGFSVVQAAVRSHPEIADYVREHPEITTSGNKTALPVLRP